jgi:hypothetical protein
MRVHSRVIRGHFQREARRVEVLDRTRIPPPANGIPRPSERRDVSVAVTKTPCPPVASAARGQLTFYFYEPYCSPRLGGQSRHELAIAGWIVAEKRYAPQLLAWANRRLSVERFRAKQRARAEAICRRHELQVKAVEQRLSAITRNLGAMVRRLDNLRFADTRTIAGITSEIRRLAAHEAAPQLTKF